MAQQPLILILGGPNGVGKSTAAARIVPIQVPFLNADEIAKGLPGYPSPATDLRAGRVLLRRIDELEAQRGSLAIETTLASRMLAPRIVRMRSIGYVFQLIFIRSPSVELCIARVAARVRSGGHAIPEATIRRRYRSGLTNFFGLYQPLADQWTVLDNTDVAGFRIIAEGGRDRAEIVPEPEIWSKLLHEFVPE